MPTDPYFIRPSWRSISLTRQVVPRDTFAEAFGLVNRAMEAVRSAYSDADIQVGTSRICPPVKGTILTPVLTELIENGVKHSEDGWASIEVEVSMEGSNEYPITITVTDHGPDIPEHELMPLREGTEKPLEHGSGLGLSLVKWGLSRLNGHIEFVNVEPAGWVVTL